jgi:uncharacterized protein involved in cysteine biosynthesis
MDGLVWCLLVLLSYKYILTGISLLIGIVFFSVLAARAETRMWHAICRFNGGRRAVQHQITLGKSHLR